MKDNQKRYWKGLEELGGDPEFVKYAEKEFAEYLPINGNADEENEDSSRRDFLKMMGFGIAAASLAACEAPVRKAIPYLNKPETIDPGVPNYYASTYALGGNYCSILVKTREGRPIKIEGNTLSPVTMGGTSAQVEASLLSLYDKYRLTAPQSKEGEISWADLDKVVMEKLSGAGEIRIVSNSILSPTTKKLINEFIVKYPGTVHLTYDSQSASGIIEAHQAAFQKKILPGFDFSKAKTIVSFDADFLGTWLSPIEFTKQYSRTRKVGKSKKEMSRHYQFESNLSLTGANADYRTPVKPSQQGLLAANLYNMIAEKAGATAVKAATVEAANLEKAAGDLWSNKGNSLVVSGSNDPAVQLLIAGINNLLGNYGSTLDLNKVSNYRQGSDSAMKDFINQCKAGSLDAVIFLDANPVYDHPSGGELASALEKVGLVVSTSATIDETSALAHYIAPGNHFLESWEDAEPRAGSLSLGQPTISRLFNTRQVQESLLTWSGASETEYFQYLKANWKENYFTQSDLGNFDMFWDKCLHDGVFVLPEANSELEETVDDSLSLAFSGDLSAAAGSIATNYSPKGEDLELSLYYKVTLGDGKQANNPWLQETPDPISKVTWDHYITVSKSFAKENKIVMVDSETSMAELTVDGNTFKLPVLVQPGQAVGTIGLALGFGRTSSGIVGDGLGINANPLLSEINGNVSLAVSGVGLKVLSETFKIARTQTHETYLGRESIIQETTLTNYSNGTYEKDEKFRPYISTSSGKKKPEDITLWNGHEYPNHHWGMVIDLNSCTGCAACSVACQAENNVAVVGRDEVINRREMAWIRIDRYYSSDGEDFKSLDIAAENPEVTFQPLMCQHCDNAPCETVCPVAATTHSAEGLNMMAYNRCIGTRYCANNCPYKVRRFNWFKYHDNTQFSKNSSMNNDLGKMVLNPDVTVRARGVMEKCTLCIQRIQAGKLVAKVEKRRPVDGDINTACAQACPADAIVFGDMKDPESAISKVINEENDARAYHMLEEIRVMPGITYLAKVRNKENA